MSDQPRAFPGRPNLRFLKIEAKRRLAAGEFGTLHDAQLAIAREHGLPSWTALKESVSAPGHALAQVRWVLARYAGATDPGWAAPGDDELGAHFDEHFLELVPPATLTRTLAPIAGQLATELTISRQTPLTVRGRLDGLGVEAAADAAPPHRLTTLRMYQLGDRVSDPRLAAPPSHTSGGVPAAAATVAAESVAGLGLPGLVLAGPGGGQQPWSAAQGWADLDRGQALHGSHRFPVYSVTRLITSLLPGGLAREALRPQADRAPDGAQMGLGWLLHQPKDLCGHAGGGPGAAASLLTRLSDGQTTVALANRLVPIEPVNARLARPVG